MKNNKYSVIITVVAVQFRFFFFSPQSCWRSHCPSRRWRYSRPPYTPRRCSGRSRRLVWMIRRLLRLTVWQWEFPHLRQSDGRHSWECHCSGQLGLSPPPAPPRSRAGASGTESQSWRWSSDTRGEASLLYSSWLPRWNIERSPLLSWWSPEWRGTFL